jgi:hypothetical protein
MKKFRAAFKKKKSAKQQESVIAFGSEQMKELAQKGFMIELLRRA